MDAGHIEPYVQIRVRQSEAQRAFEQSDVAATERRARYEFDEAERVYRIKKQALIFAQINVKNSRVFQNLQAINSQCDRQAATYPDVPLPHDFNQSLSQTLIPPADDADIDSADAANIFSSSERKSLSQVSHAIAPSHVPLATNLNQVINTQALNLSRSPVSRPSVPSASLPAMDTCAHIITLLSRWPGICKTYTMRWQPNRVGACPRHVLRKERCPGTSCELWKNIERDVQLSPIPANVVSDLNSMEVSLKTMKDQKKERRLSMKAEQAHTREGETPRKRARTESTNGTDLNSQRIDLNAGVSSPLPNAS